MCKNVLYFDMLDCHTFGLVELHTSANIYFFYIVMLFHLHSYDGFGLEIITTKVENN